MENPYFWLQMKIDRSHLFIAVSSVALLIVLIIQVNWIYKTAHIREELFNEKAIIVLSKTAQALSSDTTTRRRLDRCVGQNEVNKIDGIFRYYMQLYNINIKYYFEVKQRPVGPMAGGVFNCQPEGLVTCLPEMPASANGTELKLIFPDKEDYILEEMGVPFFTSVALLVVVLVMSWRSTLSLLREKTISEHTTDFLNNMTHEFKTPLTNIALAGKMIVKEGNIKQEEKVKHYSGIILEENEKLRLQVEHVLSMTALERGEIPLQKTELDVHELIEGCFKNISLQIENKQGSLQLNLGATGRRVWGDKTHLANALCNLIDNAIKYSKEKPEILVNTFNAGNKLVIEISDKGIGIEEKYQDKVFDKFFRVPTGDKHDVKGFGLGLAYMKKIIELHGGSVELHSHTGKGSTFTITLPYG